MKKITILALVLVLCLASLGVGYAKWTDEIIIHGTVETGSVELERVGYYSGTYVYKDLVTEELVKTQPGPSDNTDYLLIGSAWAEPNPYHEEVIMMTWDNIFPTCFPWQADASLHYAGTVPAVVSAIEVEYGPHSGWIAPYVSIFLNKQGGGPVIEGETELYFCDIVNLNVWVDLPQDNELMSSSATMNIRIVVEQWAEC
jgi:hypothetical protein